MPERDELTEIDKLVIEDWRKRGVPVPAPRMTEEELEVFSQKLRAVMRRLEDRLADTPARPAEDG
jgi:hypothetical protein